jgi:hypothetical protein
MKRKVGEDSSLCDTPVKKNKHEITIAEIRELFRSTEIQAIINPIKDKNAVAFGYIFLASIVDVDMNE